MLHRIGLRVRDARRAHGWTQDEIALRAGISAVAVRRVENANAGSIATLAAILAVLPVVMPALPPHGTLGCRVRLARERRGWSVSDLAVHADLLPKTVAGIERGHGWITSLIAVMGALAPQARHRPPRIPSSTPPPTNQGSATIIVGDCVVEMPKLMGSTVDLVVSSPPYHLNKHYEVMDGVDNAAGARTFAKHWMTEAVRLMRPGASMLLILGSMRTSSWTTLPLSHVYAGVGQNLGLNFVQEIIWNYQSGRAMWNAYSHRHETIIWLSKGKPSTFMLDDIRDLNLNQTVDPRNHPSGRSPGSVWRADRIPGNAYDRPDHPCVVPDEIAHRIIRAHSRPGEVVLDPYAGSGTLGVAAISSGRNFIGIERDENFARIMHSQFDMH